MRRLRAVLTGAPPFLVGSGVAAAVSVSAGLLLYSEEGLIGALTLILTVETLALALGLWLGGGSPEDSLVEGLRRRWLFSLVCFTVAAAYSAGLEFLGGLAGSALGQGLGLGLLGSLPLFALGSLLGFTARSREEMGGAVQGVGAPALVGLAVGFLLTGLVLAPRLAPASVYLLWMVILSAGALLQGRALDRGELREVQARARTPFGEVRVEDRTVERGGEKVRALLENDRLRGLEGPRGELERAWERSVLAALRGATRGSVPHLSPVLYLGGGSGTLARHLQGDLPGVDIHLLERNPALPEMAREHLHPWEGWQSVRLQTGDPRTLLQGLKEEYPVGLVDAGVLPWLGPVPVLDEEEWRLLRGALHDRGTLVMGGIPGPGERGDLPLKRLQARGSRWFSRVALYEWDQEVFLLFQGPEAPPWSPALPPFRLRAGDGI